MLLNFWYACELSTAVSEKPRKVRILGQDLVLYRTADKVVALSNLCVHRGGSLSGGWLDGKGCVVCPYHGWRFDSQGRCVTIPANSPEAPLPKRARVDSYPTAERYGFVWVFLGDLFEKERPPIPELPEFSEPGWRPLWGEYHWNAHYARVIENGLDFAHGPFVHRQSFGNLDEPEIPDYAVKLDEWSGTASLDMPASRPSGLWRFVQRKKGQPVPVKLTFHMPNLVRIDLKPFGDWRIIIFDTNIPVDETHTRTLWLALRSFFKSPLADGSARKRTLAIFDEDRPVVEAIEPKIPGRDGQGELPVKSDQLPLAYRRLRRRYLDMGWGVDGSRSREAGRPLCIPSPGRREQDGSWVVDLLPRSEVRSS